MRVVSECAETMVCGGDGSYHVECHDILEGDLAGSVALHEDLVDDLGTATGR